MKLELGIMAGAETKVFLKELTEIVERFEKVVTILRSPEEIAKHAVKAAGVDIVIPPTSLGVPEIPFETPVKRARGRPPKAKIEDPFENTEAESPDTDDSEDEYTDCENDFLGDQPPKKVAATTKKEVTLDELTSACRRRAEKDGSPKMVVSILEKAFKVKRVTDIKPADYEKALKLVTA